MKPERRAVIDVGTNSIKLLVADVAGTEVRPVLEQSHQTRLGQGFYGTGRLQPGRIAETAKTVAEFVSHAREHSTSYIRCIATSAAREAANSDQLSLAIEEASGLKIEIISGAEEADLAFRGVGTDPFVAEQPVLLLEVGGGSTQFILGHDQRREFLQSFPIGSVRLLEKLPHSDPPKATELAACRAWLGEFLQKEVRPKLLPSIQRETVSNSGVLQLVGSGGTASILGCIEGKLEHFDRSRIEGTRLSFQRIRFHVEALWSVPLEQRKQTVGLPKNRADVILTGSAIYEAVMQHFNFRELRISTRGLRFGAILQAKT
jgi:exopolyphosphatase/guanosine-5'-triphosphate,3'-diphosphate pyrophosphatase